MIVFIELEEQKNEDDLELEEQKNEDDLMAIPDRFKIWPASCHERV